MGAADAILRHCTFLGNEAGVGGGIFSSGYFQEEGAQDLILENCLLQGNTAQDAGAIRSGFNPILRIVSSTIANNEATNGISGGVFTRAGVADLDNTILHGNSGINGTSQTSQIRHFDGGTISINFCLVDGWSGSLGGVGNFGGDPLFPDPLGPDGQPGTGDEDLSIGAGSPCIDSGSNLVLPVGLDLDLAGNPRRSDDPDTPDTGAGTAPITDIGAYEFAGGATDVAEDSIRGAETFRLWPNPASGQIHVAFVLSKPARVRIEVVDAGGRVVSVPLADRLLTAGEHALRCDLNPPGRPPLAAGVYWVRIRDGLAPRSETLVLRR
jgi:hypothetical protein